MPVVLLTAVPDLGTVGRVEEGTGTFKTAVENEGDKSKKSFEEETQRELPVRTQK